ncbi:MAG: hypothetical protein MUE96_06625 [Bacteroidia bacterium]|nr:hypothetical protein [Bacteroidia bacterium]
MRNNFKIKCLLVLMITLLIQTVNAWPLPRKYDGFRWSSSSSGTLSCRGGGVCAEVIDGVIYFSRWQGNWNYDRILDEVNDAQYFITNVQEVSND